MASKKITSSDEREVLEGEVLAYIAKYGTARLRDLLPLSKRVRAPNESKLDHERAVDRELDRALQRLSKRGAIRFDRESGWQLVSGGVR